MADNFEHFKIPEYCPACSNLLNLEGKFLYCRSRSCPVQLSGSVRVWIKRLGLLHWGDSLIDTLTDPNNPKINSLADLYRLEVAEIAECTSGMKMAQKCWDVLHSNKKITLELLIASLNIPNLAVATSTDIVQAGYDTVEKILSLTLEQLNSIKNIGSITARQVYDGLQERKEIILDLVSVLEIQGPKLGPLSGKSFCITGATSRPRPAVQKLILDAGGIVKTSSGAGLSYLVTNETDTNSKKMQNAKKYGTEIISESRLYKMMDMVPFDVTS